MTIYEVIDNFFRWVFPQTIYNLYYPIIEIMSFTMTLIVIFGIIILPLWRLATYLIPKGSSK
jgi:hypothetical protein